MLLFKKTTKKKLSPATIQLQLGVSPPLYPSEKYKSKSISPLYPSEKYKSKSISPLYPSEKYKSKSISPQKRRETNKSYTSHDIREGINEYYKSIPYNKPKINWKTKINILTNNLKKTLFAKEKPVILNLGVSPPSKNEQTYIQHNSLTNKNIRKLIGGKIIAKPSRKPNKQKNLQKIN